MGRGLKYLGLFLVTFLLCGCVKFKYEMDISASKSMNLSLIYALDTSVFGEDTNSMTEEDLAEVKKEGYKIEEYKEGTYKGYKISKKIKNIDDVSSESDEKYSISSILDSDSNNKFIFKVEKGFLKNKYTAKFEFDGSKSGLNDLMVEDEDEDLFTTDAEDSWITDDEEDDITTADFDELDNSFIISDEDEDDEKDAADMEDMAEQLAGSMDLSFSVKLPHKALSNNATSVSNNGKMLKWKLSNSDQKPIEFSFELYNPMALILCIGLPVLIIAAVIFIILKKKGGKNKVVPTENPVPSTPLPNNLTPSIQVPASNSLEPGIAPVVPAESAVPTADVDLAPVANVPVTSEVASVVPDTPVAGNMAPQDINLGTESPAVEENTTPPSGI